MSNHPLDSWSAPNSQWTLLEIREMSVATLVQNLIQWIPQPKFHGPYASMEGTGRNIQEDVYENPDRYTNDLQLFQKIKEPTYIRHVISGFRMALVNKKKFNWLPVLDLCDWVVKKNINEVPRRIEYELKSWNQDPDWKPTRHQIAMLLSSGLAQKVDEGGIPFSEKKRVWEIISRLIKTSTDEDILNAEKETTFKSSSYYELAINDGFTYAFEDTIQYALWVRRNLEQTQVKTSEQLKDEGFSNFEEVKNVLNQYLDKPASFSLHSIYGRWLPWLALLDRVWVGSALVKIFPEDKKLEKYWKVAWGAYIKYCQPYNLAFELLESQYEKASDSLKNNPSDEQREEKIEQEAWVEHILIFYVRGLISLNHLLMKQLFKKGNPKLLAHAIRFLSVVLKNLKDSETQDPHKPVEKIQELWERRFPNASNEELDAFVLWSESQVMDKKWLFVQLKQILLKNYPIENDYRLLEAFIELSKNFSEEVFICLKLLTQHKTLDERVPWFEDHLPPLFRNILNSKKINSGDFLKVLGVYQEKVRSSFVKERLEKILK